MGLPAIEFHATNVVNIHAAPGVLANYPGAFRNRATTAITSSD